jgi:hypothetical protein
MYDRNSSTWPDISKSGRISARKRGGRSSISLSEGKNYKYCIQSEDFVKYAQATAIFTTVIQSSCY